MKNPVIDELVVAMWCVVCGFISGIWYDFFKAIRKKGFDSDLMVNIEDVLFWIGETILIYYVIYYANDGVLRWYEFLFIISGFALYRWLISDLFVFLWGKLLTVFKVIVILISKFVVKTKEKKDKYIGKFQNKNCKKQR